MSELRKDPILERWVIIAAERGRRPSDFPPAPPAPPTSGCPFCAGNEDKTPPEVAAIRPSGTCPDSAEWNVRVVPNKFPALAIEGDVTHHGIGLLDWMSGVGAHEVIIETPDHDIAFADPPYGSRKLDRVVNYWQQVPFATILGVEHAREHRLEGKAKRYDFPGDTRVTLFTAPRRRPG